MNIFLQWGNPILYEKSKLVPEPEISSPETKAIIERMFAAIKGVGVGLAAVQLGELKRIIVLDIEPTASRLDLEKGTKIVAINPEITGRSTETEDDWEGNLCMPDVMGLVRRSKRIEVSYWNEAGEQVKEKLEGFAARVFQHECEQLDGRNFIHNMPNPEKLITNGEYKKRFQK